MANLNLVYVLNTLPLKSGNLKVRLKIAEPLGANTLVHGEVLDFKIPIVISLTGVHKIEPNNDIMKFSGCRKLTSFDSTTVGV